ncbi:MAG: sigma-54-dependent Fis family transcriptional regulator [Planctomycetes bacterium]|nr:sigma-54-dependent Fis family transcriptional regulator [Planctomycetota bacterium]
MPITTPQFDARESFHVAEAVLAVVRELSDSLPDNDAVWEAFIEWRGPEEREYLRRIRAGGSYVFYTVLQDLYHFAEETCGRSVAGSVGRQLAESLLQRHLPDFLQSTLGEVGGFRAQIMWLFSQLVSGTCGDIYNLEIESDSGENVMALALTYSAEAQMVDHLTRGGHDPAGAFANSFEVFNGAVRALLGRIVHGFTPGQFHSEIGLMRGRSVIEFTPGNRFNYEGIIDLLLDYVHRLRRRRDDEPPETGDEGAQYSSEAMKAAWQAICKAAACDETILLCGESGTGKSYHARVLHEMGARRDGPFIEVGLVSDIGSDNMVQSNLFGHVRGAFTGADGDKQGLFALADGGTILLDEIGDASAELQAKLLRVIESKTFRKLGGVEDISVNVRIIAATNGDLEKMVRQGSFRMDLYYRLNVIQITLPPLRQRRRDIPRLAQILFDRVCRQTNTRGKGLTDEAFESLCDHDWPGNIRELDNALRRAVAFSDQAEITLNDLPETATRGPSSTKPAPPPALEDDSVIDDEALRRALAAASPQTETKPFKRPDHIDYARRAYLNALIEHYQGDLHEIAKHWNRSSQNTLLKLIRQFGLEEKLQTARRGDA